MSTAEDRASPTRQSHVPDGASILPLEVRPLEIGDRLELERLLLTLDQLSGFTALDRSAYDNCRIGRERAVLPSATWMAGGFLDGRLRGVVEVRAHAARGFAEAVLAVEAGWRRRGIGSALLHAAMEWAGRSGVPILRLKFSRTDLPMRRLASQADAWLDLAFDEMTAEIAVG
jgi:GNAT superfamily N-acetyltransferase